MVEKKIETFIEEVVKNKDYELIDVLWSFSISFSLLKGYLYTNTTEKKIKEWTLIVTGRNLRKKYGSKAKMRKIEEVVDFLDKLTGFLMPSSKNKFDEDKKLLKQILKDKTSDILIQNLKSNLRELSGLNLKVLSFIVDEIKQGNLTTRNDFDYYVFDCILEQNRLKEYTYLFNQYFDEELKELKLRIKLESSRLFKLYEDYSFWQLGDELVKIGIAYWSFEVSGNPPNISIKPVIVIPDFIYEYIKNLELISIDRSKIERIKERYYNSWRGVLDKINSVIVYEDVPEEEIRDEIVLHLDVLEEGLELVGKEYSTPVGSIDILCRDKDGNYVVVELKKGIGSHEVVGQIQKYMAWISENLSKDGFVRGIIVVREYDKHLEYALKGSKFPIEVKIFGTEPPVRENIKYCDNCGTPNRRSARYCRKCGQEFWM